MSNVQPEGEDIRKAVKWVSEEQRHNPGRGTEESLVEAACVKFDLSPLDAEFLSRFVRKVS